MATTRTVTFTSPSANIRQTAAARTKRVRTHFQHTRYARIITSPKYRAR